MGDSRPGALGPFAAVDVHYLAPGGACAALVTAADERFSVLTGTRTALVPEAAAYQPGEFYRRELPPLRAVLRAASHAAEVSRGRSSRPLYVTAAGISAAAAATLVREMRGAFRIPDALRLADRLARGTEQPPAGP